MKTSFLQYIISFFVVLSCVLFFLLCYVLFKNSPRLFLEKEDNSNDNWSVAGPIVAKNNISIMILTRPSHPFLAEYEQQLRVYGGTDRDGKLIGNITLWLNAGGRTAVLLFVDQKEKRNCIVLKDRSGWYLVDLEKLSYTALTDRRGPYLVDLRETDSEVLKSNDLTYIGLFSNESYPLKFIPSSVLSEKEVNSQNRK